MTILASELHARAPSVLPDNDGPANSGGAISIIPPFPGTYFGMTQPASPSILEVLSDDVADTTQGINLFGRDDNGVAQTDAITLDGTTAQILGSTVYAYVQNVFINGAYVGNITVRLSVAGATVAVFPITPQARGIETMFKNSFSDALSTTIRYEKMFWYMASTGETLTSAEVELIADPLSRIRQGIESAINDSVIVTNRLTTPGGVTFVDDSVAQAVPGGDLADDDAIGVWYEQNLPAGDPANVSTFTTQLSGQDIP